MISDLCDRGECETCFEDELDACGHECHPADCPAGEARPTTEYTGTGRAQDSADGQIPTRPVRAARETLAPGSAGRAAPPSPVGGAAPYSSPQDRERAVPAGRPTSGTGADAPLLGSAPGQRRTPRAPAGGPLASTQATSVPPDRPNPIAAAMSEAQLDAHVRELCKGLGLLRYHTHDSRRSPSGFPDLVCAGPRGILFRELKRQRGKVSAEQQQWLDALTAAGENAAVWRPASLLSGAIAAELAAISAWRVRRGQRCVCDAYGSCPQGCAMCPVCGGEAA